MYCTHQTIEVLSIREARVVVKLICLSEPTMSTEGVDSKGLADSLVCMCVCGKHAVISAYLN